MTVELRYGVASWLRLEGRVWAQTVKRGVEMRGRRWRVAGILVAEE